jgi:myosin VIIa
VNPYKVIDGLYDIDTAKKYIGKRIGAEAPHIFGRSCSLVAEVSANFYLLAHAHVGHVTVNSGLHTLSLFSLSLELLNSLLSHSPISHFPPCQPLCRFLSLALALSLSLWLCGLCLVSPLLSAGTAIADTTYRNLQEGCKSQSVIISGESGAGKTEATKLILRYLATRTNKSTVVEQQLLQANPVMEAFGNAKTVRNDNSSRFGKYTKVYFDESGCIGGAQITTYLLEKSRIVRQAAGERNYHIFYMLCKGATVQQRQRLRLREMGDFHYLSQSGCYSTDRDEVQDFAHLRGALHFLGVGDEQQEDLWTLVAAILHLGNLRFKSAAPTADESVNLDAGVAGSGAGATGAVGGGRTPRGNAKFQDGSAVSTPQVLSTVAHLLQLDARELERSLTSRVVVVGGNTLTIPVVPEAAVDLRDALAKALYDQLFQYLVMLLNRATYDIGVAQRVSPSFIGVLDIFGFENFDAHNSFEQFCINYANEKLQQQFNQHIFKDEQARYAAEGIDFSKVDYRDNQACIDLIEKRGGILSLLDEECRFPGSTDRSLLEKLHRNHDGRSPDYQKPRRLGNTHFGVRHYAGGVDYLTDGFLDKNRDTLTPGLLTLVDRSDFAFLRDMWEERIAALLPAASTTARTSSYSASAPSTPITSSRHSKTSNTVGGKFKVQLAELYQALSQTSPYYVRCIKPNSVKQADQFDDDLVSTQLRYSGMMETIRIRKLGFPVVVPFREFVVRYGCLAPADVSMDDASLLCEACERILDSVALSATLCRADSPVGTVSVFMRDIASAVLEDLRSEVGSVALEWGSARILCQFSSSLIWLTFSFSSGAPSTSLSNSLLSRFV